MNDKYFRLFIAGDPHICSKDADLWQQAMTEINAMEPHAVLVLGDLTGGPDVGSSESLANAMLAEQSKDHIPLPAMLGKSSHAVFISWQALP